MAKMSSEIKGYQVDTCFGSSGCPNPANSSDGLLKKIEEFLDKEDLLGFMKQRVKGDVKFHPKVGGGLKFESDADIGEKDSFRSGTS